MSAAIEEFERLIRHESAQELIPFLLTLAKTDFPAARTILKNLREELQTVVQVSENGWGTRATSAQSENIFLAGIVVLTRQEILRGAIRGAWIIGAHPTATATRFKADFLTLVTALRPTWLTEWLLGLQARADGWAVDYALLRALEQAQLVAYSPPLAVRALPSALHQWGWDLSLAPTMPANATEAIADQLRADHVLLIRDLPLIFDFDSPVSSIQARIQPPLPPRQEADNWAPHGERPWQIWDRTYPPQHVNWHAILLSLTASRHLDRADLLTRCLLALRRDFRRPLLTWFKELYLSLKPTLAERLARQAELTELLAHPLPLVVNFALDQLKDLLPEPGFILAPWLVSADSLLTRPDLKTGLRALLASLIKLPKQDAAHAPAVARLLATALAHPDAAVQERAAKGLAELLSARQPMLSAAETAEALATIGQQAELLGSAARTLLGPWLSATPAITISNTDSYKPLTQFVPDLSPATAIAPVADWHELLFLTGQVLRHDDPAATERWLDGLLRLHGQLPAGYAQQLQPYLGQVLPQLKKASAAEAAALLAGPIELAGHEGLGLGLLLSWATGFAAPRVASVQVLAATRSPLLGLEQQRYQLAEARLRAGLALPLLSTPTHRPYWVAPGALVSRLLAYQAVGLAPSTADLVLALTRTAHAHPTEAAEARRLLPQLAEAGLREVLGWFLGAPGQPLPALAPAGGRAAAPLHAAPLTALPELWAVAARTKAPTETFAPLAASLGYDHPGVTQPLRSTFDVVPRENGYPDPSQPGQVGTYRFMELAWSNGATAAAPSPLLAYAPPVGKSEYGSWEENALLTSDLGFFIALLPNYAAPVYDQILRCAAWADNLETTERDVLAQALRTLLGPGPALPAAATAVLASGLIHHTPLCRSLAQEVLLQAIAHGRLLPTALGQILGQQLAIGYAPAPRLADNLLPLKGIDALTDDALRQALDALLPVLPATPPRNLRPLLDTYASLLARTQQPAPAPVQAQLGAWQATASLRKISKALLAQGKA